MGDRFKAGLVKFIDRFNAGLGWACLGGLFWKGDFGVEGKLCRDFGIFFKFRFIR